MPETHHFITRAMGYDFIVINDAIIRGDIISAEAAMPRCEKLAKLYHESYRKVGCSGVRVAPYVAAGGLVGVMWTLTPPGGDEQTHSATFRSFND